MTKVLFFFSDPEAACCWRPSACMLLPTLIPTDADSPDTWDAAAY